VPAAYYSPKPAAVNPASVSLGPVSWIVLDEIFGVRKRYRLYRGAESAAVCGAAIQIQRGAM